MSENQTPAQSQCPKCQSDFPYFDGNVWVCPECSHEWHLKALETETKEEDQSIKDANGNLLQDGDCVVVKTLKVKGASSPIKAGTKVKNIKLVPNSADGHNIACKIDGFGAMGLKSEFVKKS